VTPTLKNPTGGAAADHGANLVFRPSAFDPAVLVQLPNSRVAIECAPVLEVRGPVELDAGPTVELQAMLALDVEALRFKVKSVGVIASGDDEIDPDVLRSIRWGEVFAGALDNLGKIVTLDEDGQPSRHRGVLTLTDDEKVGALWLQARLAGIDPNVHIAAQLELPSTAAAAARVKRARQRKLIPPAAQGQRR
jgi:hypothetical protein